MVLENASVEAGGYHESMIGAGFALGPAIGLIGVLLRRYTENDTTAMLIAVLPMVSVCLAASLWPLWRLRQEICLGSAQISGVDPPAVGDLESPTAIPSPQTKV